MKVAAPISFRERWGTWSAWVEVHEFEDGWSSWEHSPLRYRTSSRGGIEIAGVVMGGEPGSRVCRLPEGCRPDPKALIASRRVALDPVEGKPEEMFRIDPEGWVIAPRPLERVG